MSHGRHGGAHPYLGRNVGRGQRLKSKLGRAITAERLDALLKGGPRMADDPKPDQPDPTPDDKEKE